MPLWGNNWDNYLYLVLYNIIYVIPSGIIVLLFTLTLETRKFTEKEGHNLKLVSGMMMLKLAFLLFSAADWLNFLITAISLITLVI